VVLAGFARRSNSSANLVVEAMQSLAPTLMDKATISGSAAMPPSRFTMAQLKALAGQSQAPAIAANGDAKPQEYKVASRADAAVLMENIERYYRRQEPSSAIPLLLERARLFVDPRLLRPSSKTSVGKPPRVLITCRQVGRTRARNDRPHVSVRTARQDFRSLACGEPEIGSRPARFLRLLGDTHAWCGPPRVRRLWGSAGFLLHCRGNFGRPPPRRRGSGRRVAFAGWKFRLQEAWHCH